MCLPMKQKHFLALCTPESSTYPPQDTPATTLEETLWRSSIQPNRNCHSAENAGATGLKSNGGEHRTYSLKSIYATVRKKTELEISKFKYQNMSFLRRYSLSSRPRCGQLRPMAACHAVQSQKFKHLNIPHYSSCCKSTPQSGWWSVPTNTKFLISFYLEANSIGDRVIFHSKLRLRCQHQF